MHNLHSPNSQYDQPAMVQLTEDEIDDLVYFARAGDAAELTATLAAAVSSRAKDGEGGGKSATALVLLAAAVDEGANTPLHMAAGNGHEGGSGATRDMQATEANGSRHCPLCARPDP